MQFFRPIFAAVLTVTALLSVARAQSSHEAGADVINFTTKIGSFKMVGGAPTDPPSGHLEMSFTGTLLVVGLDGQIQVTGNLKKEYDNAKYKRVAYHGTGKVVIDGKYASAQWFGRDLTGTFKGHGIMRLYGEFDQNLETGKWSYAVSNASKRDWGTNGRTVQIPMLAAQDVPAVRVRTSGN